MSRYYRGIRIYKQVDSIEGVNEQDIQEAPTITCKIALPWDLIRNIEEYPHNDFKTHGKVTTVFLIDGDTRCVLENFESVLQKYEKYLDITDNDNLIKRN